MFTTSTLRPFIERFIFCCGPTELAFAFVNLRSIVDTRSQLHSCHDRRLSVSIPKECTPTSTPFTLSTLRTPARTTNTYSNTYYTKANVTVSRNTNFVHNAHTHEALPPPCRRGRRRTRVQPGHGLPTMCKSHTEHSSRPKHTGTRHCLAEPFFGEARQLRHIAISARKSSDDVTFGREVGVGGC